VADQESQGSVRNTVEGRIYFPGNPWPAGHRVVSCELIAAINPCFGLYIDEAAYKGPALTLAIELKTADYDEDDPSDRDGIGNDDWSSKIAWNNYGSCWIGESQSSGTPGFVVSDGQLPFSFDRDEYRFLVDLLPVDWDTFMSTRAMDVFLLGHDAVADHNIRLHSRQADGSYTLDWRGQIARAYVMDDQFKYTFSAHVTGVRFREIRLWYFHKERAMAYLGLDFDPATTTPRDYLAPFVTNPDAFTFEERVDGLGRSCTYAVPRHTTIRQGKIANV
jgi:hypothetical protein